MGISEKIKGFYGKIKAFAKAKPVSKPLTRYQFYMKIITLYICAVGLDLSGNKVFNFEVDYAYQRISAEAAFGWEYTYYMAVSALFLGLAFWKLLELYWMGKDAVK